MKKSLASFSYFWKCEVFETQDQAPVLFPVENTVQPRYDDPRYHEVPGITMNVLCPGKMYSKMYGTEPRYNDIPDITMGI